MKKNLISRRRLLFSAAAAIPAGLAFDLMVVEPRWLKVRHVDIAGRAGPSLRLAHFTDLHHKGNRGWLRKVVRHINRLEPDLVCFTGDLIEDAPYLVECLDILSEIRRPLFGVPGNHDYWAEVPFDIIVKAFASTGGAWLLDQQVTLPGGGWSLYGATCLGSKGPPIQINPATKNILLIHYPAWVKRVTERFDLVLAGHSHGGQVRLPFYGPLMVPFGVDEYDVGLFQTPAGPLYVNPGIGWFAVPFRFNCRPEITVFQL